MAKDTKKGVDLEEAKRSAPQGVNYLLAVAIDDYRHCPRLYNCVRDANDLAKLLTERYLFEPQNVTALINEEATRSNIYNTLRKLASETTSRDNVLIYFSGHGEYDKIFKQGYWIPVDAPQGHYDLYIPNSEIKTILNAINSHHTFLMVDSCFAGALFAKGVGKNVSKRYEADPSRWGLTSGRNEVVSDGKPGDNSPFAESLLYRLRQNTTSLGVSELCSYVVEYVQANSSQTPIGEPLKVEGHKNGQFVFHLRKDEAVDWAAAKKTNSLAGYRQFLKTHPESKYATDARKQVEGMEEEAAWNRAKTINTLAAYDDYLDAYPQGRYAEEAEERMEALDEENTWQQAVARGTLPGFSKYLRAYPAGKYAEEARKKKQELKAGPEPRPKPIMAKKVEEPPPKPTPPPREKPAEKKQHIALKNMVFIEGGSFEMGDLFGDGPGDEKSVHKVKVSDFYLGACTITFEEYDAFCQATKRDKPDDSGWGRGCRPVINVSWFDAVEYCNWRSKQEGLEPCFQWTKEVVEEKSFFGLIKGRKEIEKIYCDFSLNGYRLPTEAEWEYAARQRGQKVRFGNGKDIADPAEINFDGSAQYKKPYSKEGVYRAKTTEVGSFAPNSLGLYDMSGNVLEWCWDWYDSEYYKKSNNVQDPKGPDSGSPRVLRGGSWRNNPVYARCSFRYLDHPDYGDFRYGFRLARIV